MPLEKADISKLARDRLEAADADQDDGARRQDRHLRAAVPADQLRSVEEVSDRQQRLSRSADRQHRQPRLHRRARRSPGARRARLRRRHHRRHGHAGTIEGVPGRVLRRDGTRQHDPRSDRRHEGAGAEVSVDRSVARGHLGPLGRRLRDDDRDVPLPGLLQGRASPSRATTISARTKTTGASATRACS